jgi:hypothetical protein
MKSYNIFFIKRSILPALVVFFLFACSEDFLDVVPIDRIPKDAFFKSESDLIAAVNGVYVAQRNIFTSGEMPLHHIQESRSDNTHDKFARQNEHRAVDNFTADAGNNFNSWLWRDSYYCINACNTVIDRAPSINMDESLKNRLVGEVKFIRASTYFSLVKDFGGVPLRLDETVSLTGNNNMARAPVEDVYNHIVSDLEFAAVNLPASYEGSNVGRATSGAALGLMGKVELQRGNKSAAETSLRAVVNSNQYNLLENYADLWIPNNRNNRESLYEIQHLPPNSGSPYWNYFAPLSLGVPGGNVGNTAPNTPTLDLINAYEAGDERLGASIAFDPGGRPYIIKFKDAGVTAGFDARNNFPVLRYADVLLLLAEAIGESPESYDLINQVRNRAGLGDIDASTSGTFMEKLMHERQVELAFELHRWHDLLRLPSSETISIMNAHLANEFPGQNISIAENDLLNAIPVSELQSNSEIKQNDGY